MTRSWPASSRLPLPNASPDAWAAWLLAAATPDPIPAIVAAHARRDAAVRAYALAFDGPRSVTCEPGPTITLEPTMEPMSPCMLEWTLRLRFA